MINDTFGIAERVGARSTEHGAADRTADCGLRRCSVVGATERAVAGGRLWVAVDG